MKGTLSEHDENQSSRQNKGDAEWQIVEAVLRVYDPTAFDCKF
jgi:hypothetical protein